MNQVNEIVFKIFKDVIDTLYMSLCCSIYITFIAFFLFIYIQKKYKKKVKKGLLIWFLFENSQLIRLFFLMLYGTLILSKTIFYRNFWANPLSDIMGVWGLYDADGNLTTQPIENLMLFIPFAVLLLWAFRNELLGDKPGLKKTLWVATKTVGIFSFAIEFSQLLFHLGTFQISDLVYNTLGGTVGGLAYYIIYRFRHRNE